MLVNDTGASIINYGPKFTHASAVSYVAGNSCDMPARWQSSQRPMYVRTVWVDGFRHAILTPDDPYYTKIKRRPHSSASTTQYSRNSRLSIRDEGERKLSLVIRSDKSKIVSKQRPKSHVPIELLNLKDLELESEDDFLLKANPQPIYEYDSNRSNYDLSANMRAFKTNRTARNECKENTDLSDRVLQWLDLAGKIDLLAPNAERMAQPRHSWPEIQKRNHCLSKSKTTVDIRVKEEVKTPKDSARTHQSIDRDYQVPPSAATIETYARQSRNRNTPRDAKKDKSKRDIRANVLETRQKVVTERNAVEKQYAELVSKKLIPDLGKGKKQVHIFMPEMIKKNCNSRSESLLSQIS